MTNPKIFPGRASEFVLKLSCPDGPGIVHAVSGLLFEHGCNIIDSQQYGDEASGRFIMRIHFAADAQRDASAWRVEFEPVAARFGMAFDVHDLAVRPRVLILCSQHDHCLNDLLYRHRKGALPMEIVAVVSNHRDVYQLVAAHGIPFEYLPITPGTKVAQERRLMEMVSTERIDCMVLARWMQILTPATCEAMPGRIINIHHSFLPGFKGARPYHQAHERGVKIIGATAHYVTPDLDEGPIIEQDVVRVDHSMSAADLAEAGRDIEQQVLARAVRWQVEHRIVLVGKRTVVFR